MLRSVLAAYEAQTDEERSDLERMRALVERSADPWTRSSPLHVTGSAVVVHPPTKRVLLRWHDRMHSWLQVGGHADPAETDPFAIALREAREETGLQDLVAWPDESRPRILQVAVVPVPAGRGEPAHHHADVRYGLSTAQPDAIIPENEGAQLRWMTLEEAESAVAEDNLRVSLVRVGAILGECI
ncbi:MAG: NUDIX domain-containing protein [Chloroflexi bacterium]|nr:NUDIX domain-containing protein [Chloroflexota bacterium]